MVMIDFNNLISSKPMDAKANIKSNFNICSAGTDYKQVMEKAIRQRENQNTPQKSESSRLDDANVQNKYKNKEKNQAPANEVRTKKEIKDIKEARTKKEVKKDIKEDDFEQQSVKDNDITIEIDMAETILHMLSGMLNIQTDDKEAAKDILRSELSEIDYSGLDKSALIENINAIAKDVKIEDIEDFDEIINNIKSLILNQNASSIEDEEPISMDRNYSEINLTKDKVLSDLRSLDHSLTNIAIKPVSESKTAKTEMNYEESDGKINDIDAETNEVTDLLEKADNDIDMRKQNKGSDFLKMQEKINNDIDDLGTNYAAIDEKSFDIHNDTKTLYRNPLLDRTQIINKEEILKQIAESSQLLDSEGVTELRIRLKPDSLGKVTVRLIMENGEMTAKFIAESHRVKETIESSFSELKESLSQKGINIQSLSVSVGNQERWQKDNSNFNAWKSNNKRISDIEDTIRESGENITIYENPYYVNEGLLDIRV